MRPSPSARGGRDDPKDVAAAQAQIKRDSRFHRGAAETNTKSLGASGDRDISETDLRRGFAAAKRSLGIKMSQRM
jgi:hypothetical protein